MISTHAPLAGRDILATSAQAVDAISTHAPLAGRDYCGTDNITEVKDISTHAPLAGRDAS